LPMIPQPFGLSLGVEYLRVVGRAVLSPPHVAAW
jgi:hypothetical protein